MKVKDRGERTVFSGSSNTFPNIELQEGDTIQLRCPASFRGVYVPMSVHIKVGHDGKLEIEDDHSMVTKFTEAELR